MDPLLFSKRPKGTDNSSFSKDSFVKPSFILTKSATTGDVSYGSTPKTVATPRPRAHLNPKSSTTKINTGIAKSTPLSAPAGRSPTRGKRSGILSSRRRTGGSFRIDPPAFGLSKSTPPFSLDAALKGTIPSYTSRNVPSPLNKSSSAAASTASAAVSASASAPSVDFRSLHEPEPKSSWDFVIHEDTPEQEMTNLLQHGTCVLDISSDEETESRRQLERAEGKENVPPPDDVSQTSRPRAARLAAAAVDADDMVFEKERRPLGEMDVREYYSEGCDETSIIIVPGDEDEDPQESQDQQQKQQNQPASKVLESVPELAPTIEITAPELVSEKSKTVDELMQKTDEPAPCAAVLEPLEGTGESFEVWESGSAKDETEVVSVAAVCS